MIVLTGAVWMITLLCSLLFPPHADGPMRTRERVLIVVSILMILLLAVGALIFR